MLPGIHLLCYIFLSLDDQLTGTQNNTGKGELATRVLILRVASGIHFGIPRVMKEYIPFPQSVFLEENIFIT